MNKTIMTAALGLAATIAVAGCHSSAKTGVTPSKAAGAKASISAFASSSQGQFDRTQAQALVKKCLPASETAQLKLAEPVKGKTARKGVETCLAIPPANRTAFDDALLNDAIHGHLGTKTGDTVFIETTLPDLVVKYRG